MEYFYGRVIDDQYAELTQEDSQHCARVLRKKQGDSIHFTDGLGHLYQGLILEQKPVIRIEVTDKKEFEALPYQLHLVVAPTKNINRTEFMLEKAIELGLTSLKAIWSDNSERKKIREDRLEKIAIAAMKQSQKTFLTTIKESSKISQHKSEADKKFIAHCNAGFPREYLSDHIELNSSHEVLIGPEGDFNEKELEWALEQGYQPIHLGNNRLRTETAGIFVAALFYHHYLSHS